MAGSHATFAIGSRRRAETAQPSSRTVPASTRKLRFSRAVRRVWIPAGVRRSTHTTSTPADGYTSPASRASFELLEAAPPPINQGDVVLAGRAAGICCPGRTRIAVTLEVEHELD